MYITFLDDSKQNNPTREGMNSLLSIGGILLKDHFVKKAEREIKELCDKTGFPKNDEFKWSPGKELWMRDKLVEEERKEFFEKVINILSENDAKIISIIVDKTSKCATNTEDNQIDAINLILERIEKVLEYNNEEGIVVIDRPSGGRSDEDSFLFETLETIQSGTEYGVPEHICFNIVSSPSKFIRLLQAADLITASILAYVSGEDCYSPPFFKLYRKMFCKYEKRIGGIGLKIHPDYKYKNLYHWLVNDTHIWRRGVGLRLPIKDCMYYENKDKK